MFLSEVMLQSCLRGSDWHRPKNWQDARWTLFLKKNSMYEVGIAVYFFMLRVDPTGSEMSETSPTIEFTKLK